MFGFKFQTLIKETYDFITSKLAKPESNVTKIIGQRDIIEGS